MRNYSKSVVTCLWSRSLGGSCSAIEVHFSLTCFRWKVAVHIAFFIYSRHDVPSDCLMSRRGGRWCDFSVCLAHETAVESPSPATKQPFTLDFHVLTLTTQSVLCCSAFTALSSLTVCISSIWWHLYIWTLILSLTGTENSVYLL